MRKTGRERWWSSKRRGKTRFLLSRCFFRSQVAFALLFLALLRANRLSKCFRGTQRIERGCKTTRCRRRRPPPAPAGILEMLERVAKSKGINYEEWFEASSTWHALLYLLSCVQLAGKPAPWHCQHPALVTVCRRCPPRCPTRPLCCRASSTRTRSMWRCTERLLPLATPWQDHCTCWHHLASAASPPKHPTSRPPCLLARSLACAPLPLGWALIFGTPRSARRLLLLFSLSSAN